MPLDNGAVAIAAYNKMEAGVDPTPVDLVPMAVVEGSFILSGVNVRVYMLADGRRIINAEDLGRILQAWGGPATPAPTEDEIQQYARWAKGN